LNLVDKSKISENTSSIAEKRERKSQNKNKLKWIVEGLVVRVINDKI